jgi:putative endonuclease
VYYEEFASAYDAITREKQLKAGPRRKKMELADSFNPRWRDFYEDVVDEEEGTLRLP